MGNPNKPECADECRRLCPVYAEMAARFEARVEAAATAGTAEAMVDGVLFPEEADSVQIGVASIEAQRDAALGRLTIGCEQGPELAHRWLVGLVAMVGGALDVNYKCTSSSRQQFGTV